MRKCKDWLTTWMSYMDNKEPPTLMKQWVGISTIAAALQRKCWLEWHEPIYPNFYVVLVGPSAVRKSTAISPGRKLLREQDCVRMAPTSITREAFLKNLESCAQNTMEGEQHSSLTICSSELAVFLGQKDPRIISDLTDLYDCIDPFVYETIGRGVNQVTNPWVNILGAITPDTLRQILPNASIEGGLTSRIVFVWGGEKCKLVPLPIETQAEKQLFNDLSDDLSFITHMEGCFKLTDEFIQTHAKWYVDQEHTPPFDDPKLEYYMGRRPMHLLKLCMVVSASEGDTMELTPEIHGRALELLKMAEADMPQVFAGYGALDHTDVINNVIKFMKGRKEATFGQIWKVFMRDATKDQLTEIVEGLVESKFLSLTCRKPVTYSVTKKES